MYYILFFCGVVSVVTADQYIVRLPPAFIEKVTPYIKKCETETGAPTDTFKKLLGGIIENEASLKFSYCYLLTTKYITEDGRLASTLAKHVKLDDVKETFVKFLEDCNKADGKDHLDVLRKVLECYKKDTPVLFTM